MRNINSPTNYDRPIHYKTNICVYVYVFNKRENSNNYLINSGTQ